MCSAMAVKVPCPSLLPAAHVTSTGNGDTRVSWVKITVHLNSNPTNKITAHLNSNSTLPDPKGFQKIGKMIVWGLLFFSPQCFLPENAIRTTVHVYRHVDYGWFIQALFKCLCVTGAVSCLYCLFWKFYPFIKKTDVRLLGDRTTSTLVSITDPEEFSMPKIRCKTLDIWWVFNM